MATVKAKPKAPVAETRLVSIRRVKKGRSVVRIVKGRVEAVYAMFSVRPGVWELWKQGDEPAIYEVSCVAGVWECSCEGFRHRRACKHEAACRVLRQREWI